MLAGVEDLVSLQNTVEHNASDVIRAPSLSWTLSDFFHPSFSKEPTDKSLSNGDLSLILVCKTDVKTRKTERTLEIVR